MSYNYDKIDDAALALLFLTTFRNGRVTRAWKGMDWDTMKRLYEKEYISDPRSKSKSVILTDKGQQRSEELFHDLFDAP